MEPKGKIYRCPLTGKYTDVLHEIFYGRGVRKEYGIKYNLQIPLYYTEHIPKAHREKEKYQRIFCNLIGIDFEKTRLAINNNDIIYLNSISDRCKKYINNLEI